MKTNNPQDPATDKEIIEMSTGKLLIMSIVSANVYFFLSIIIIKYWHDGWIVDLFNSQFTVWSQVGVGLGAGIIASAIVYLVINLPPLSTVLSDFSVFRALSKARFSLFDKTQISFFAGTGEELLFRGAIQPLLGNWITSAIFIGIHGYFKFRSAGHILFGIMMFCLSLMLGYLTSEIGLISAMIAHSVYDLIMLILIQKKDQKLG